MDEVIECISKPNVDEQIMLIGADGVPVGYFISLPLMRKIEGNTNFKLVEK